MLYLHFLGVCIVSHCIALHPNLDAQGAESGAGGAGRRHGSNAYRSFHLLERPFPFRYRVFNYKSLFLSLHHTTHVHFYR